MAETKTYTPQGFKALQDELDYLETVKVEENKKEISTARSFGDLSENSEYDEAKAEQGKIHARIAELREMIAHAKIVDESQIDESKISVGSIVKVFNKTRNIEVTYHIVGSYETDPLNGKISDSSPIGLSLLGAKAGDTVTVTGAREQVLEVKSVARAKE
ncbi:MAG: transcription elongation factor GreA [Ruminococcaceae bacterium]|nr:transcription elongation factor GreA [Oscillospiraceae bacterium]